jgi:predicted  nucleic acid-binding Zn-ribbon protein
MRLAIAATTLIALCGCSGNTTDGDKLDDDRIEDAVVEKAQESADPDASKDEEKEEETADDKASPDATSEEKSAVEKPADTGRITISGSLNAVIYEMSPAGLDITGEDGKGYLATINQPAFDTLMDDFTGLGQKVSLECDPGDGKEVNGYREVGNCDLVS